MKTNTLGRPFAVAMFLASALVGCAPLVAPPGVSLGQDAMIRQGCDYEAQTRTPHAEVNIPNRNQGPALLAAAGSSIFEAAIRAGLSHDCLQRYGYTLPGAPTLVAMTPTSMPFPGPPMEGAPVAMASATPQSEDAARAIRAAEAWTEATRLMNLPSANPRKRDMFLVLCGAGDNSSCFMASALQDRTFR